MDRGSIYERVGGAPAFRALAAAHHARCLADPLVSHPFSHGVHPDHVQRLADYWGAVFGGLEGSSAGHSAMLRVHAGTGIDAPTGEAFAACFVEALDDAGWPQDEQLRAVLRAYIEWAVADVMAVSPAGSPVDDALVVPRWSWDGLQR